MKTKLQVESQTAVESEKNYTKPRRTTNIFGVFDFKTRQGRSKRKGKYFWIFELQLENQKDKVKLQLEMKNKNKTTTRIKLNKAKRNNKNIFGILGFEKINNTSRNKQEKAKHEYTKN